MNLRVDAGICDEERKKLNLESDSSTLGKISIRGLALALVGLLGGCASGLDIPGLGKDGGPAIPSVGQPITKTALNSQPDRSRNTVQSVRARRTPKSSCTSL